MYLYCVCCIESVLWQPEEYGCLKLLITAEYIPVFSDIVKQGRCRQTSFEWPFVLSSRLAAITQFDSAICQQGSSNLATGQAAPAEKNHVNAGRVTAGRWPAVTPSAATTSHMCVCSGPSTDLKRDCLLKGNTLCVCGAPVPQCHWCGTFPQLIGFILMAAWLCKRRQ